MLLYEKSVLEDFCGITVQARECKRKLMPFILPYLLFFLWTKSQETYQHKLQRTLQKVVVAGTRKISVKDCM